MKSLVAYITAGFPSNEFTIDLALSLKEAGVDFLELGIPFSDPVADGPIIEKANLKALENGFKLGHLFEISDAIATEIDTLWMGYFNSFYHRGFEGFSDRAKQAGVSGFIIPDLPHEEAVTYIPTMDEKALALISFVAPTDSKERIKEVVENSKKFIYLVAYAGITGSGASEDLSQTIENIRAVSKTPIHVGFGVDEQTAKEKAKNVDGVIVGSAFVKILLDDSISNSEKIKRISNSARIIKESINS